MFKIFLNNMFFKLNFKIPMTSLGGNQANMLMKTSQNVSSATTNIFLQNYVILNIILGIVSLVPES